MDFAKQDAANMPAQQSAGGTFSGLGNPYKLAFEQSWHIQCIINLEGRLLALNAKALHLLTGEQHKQVLGKRLWHAPWWRPEQGLLIKDLFVLATEGQSAEASFDFGLQGDLPRPYHISLSAVRNVFAEIIAILLEAHPVDSKPKRLNSQKFLDPLTGLADKNYLIPYLTGIIHKSKNDPSHSFAVLNISVDNFSSIGNLFGQSIADSFIINLARKFRANSRDGDLVARVGENAFIIVLDHLQVTQNAYDFAQRCLRFLETECDVGEVHLKITAQIGIAIGDGGTDVKNLLQQSAKALRQAQEDPQNPIVFYGLDKLESA